MKISEIELTKEQIHILKLLKKGKILDKSEFKEDVLNPLFQHRFLSFEPFIQNNVIDYSKGKLILNQSGYDWLEISKKIEFRFWYPHLVATLALVISIIALLKP
ncbi:MAG: hypothetical protein U0M41_00600 [Negativibacillus sp.]|nr:hypothetical protein [Negativibacillus sp.]